MAVAVIQYDELVYAGDVLVLLGYGKEDVLRSMAHVEPVYSFRSEFSYVNNLRLTTATSSTKAEKDR
jgi:hypothetical protein